MTPRDYRFIKIIPFIIAVIFFCLPAGTACGSNSDDSIPSPRTNRYVFLSGSSTLIQSGGFAGIRRHYSVKGNFDLTVDFETAIASFINVDAIATDDSSPQNKLDPNEVFNMTLLTGSVIDETQIEFTGQAGDGSDINITATFEDDLVHLTAATIPPPDSADFFIFEMDTVAQRKYNGGTGEPNNPYLINTAEQMNTIGTEPNDWDKHFKLTADIDFSAYDGKDGRPAYNIIAPDTDLTESGFQGIPFTGVFDGNFHTISNFSYTFSGSVYNSSTGIFGMVDDPNALIINIGLINPSINTDGAHVGSIAASLNAGTIMNCYAEGGSISGDRLVGGLVGDNLGTIISCYSSVNVSGTAQIGGLVGFSLWGSNIINCSASGNISGSGAIGGLTGHNYRTNIISCYSTGSVICEGYGGGLIGMNELGSLVSNCYSHSDVRGLEKIGGLIGHNFVSDIIDCYSTGTVTGVFDTGGLIGIDYGGRVYNSYWDTETSDQATSYGGIGKTTAEMQMQNTFTDAGWDFIDETQNGTEDIWWIDEGNDYPRLWWEFLND